MAGTRAAPGRRGADVTADAPASTARLEVSPLVSGAIAEIEPIERDSFPRPWSAETFAAELARDDRRYLVGRVDGRAVGFAGVADLAGDAHVMSLAVAPAARGRGHARVLLAALLAAARDELRAHRATLEVRESNLAARTLYRRAGFVESGRRPGYYGDDGEAAVVLWCDDLDAAVARLDASASVAATPETPADPPVSPTTSRR
ncbi:ribosomal-protein-alanine N-acetyltransferase [Nitriliruptoraceae bacterium ZYF776]|nr:ribosomal-protein-alanine N-acetyltransferase [Profundirhabdus halotolerans]